MNKKAGQKRSPVSWLMELAAPADGSTCSAY